MWAVAAARAQSLGPAELAQPAQAEVAASGSGTFGAGGSGGSGATGGSGDAAAGATGSGAVDAAGGSAGSSGSGGTGSPTGALLFEDFEDGMANGWIADVDDGNDNVGNWAVVTEGASKVYKEQTEYSDPSWAVGGDSRWTNQVLETKVQFVSSSAGDAIAYLAVRLTEQRALLLPRIPGERDQRQPEGQKARRRQHDRPDSVSQDQHAGGAGHLVHDRSFGGRYDDHRDLNGTAIGTATDSALPNGGIAVGIRDAVAIFDDVKVTAP